MAPKSTLDIFGGAHVGQADGITIWRIENMAPVEQPKDTYGKFFAGDSYIVLNRFEVKGSVKARTQACRRSVQPRKQQEPATRCVCDSSP